MSVRIATATNTNAYVLTTRLPSFATFTMMAWVRLTSVAVFSDIFARGTANEMLFQCTDVGNLEVFDGAGNQSLGHALDANVWMHIAVTKGGGKMRGWKNGRAGTEITVTTAMGTDKVWIGGGSSSESTRGDMAAVKIWDRELSQSEIQAEMKQVMPRERRGIYAVYPFIGTGGQTGVGREAIDYSGFGRTLTKAGTSQSTQVDPPGVIWDLRRSILGKKASSGAQSITADSPIATWTIPSASVNRTVVADSGVASWSVPAPALNVRITLTADTPISTWSVPSPTLVTPRTLSADSPLSTWTVPSATVVPGVAAIAAGSATATWTVPAASISAGGGPQTIVGDSAVATWTIPSPTVVLQIVGNSASSSWTVPAPTVVPGAATISAGSAVSVWVVPDPALNGATVVPDALKLFGWHKMTKQ